MASSRATEKEPAVFYEYFVQGLKGLAADEDKDKKVSIWEAFKYATAGVDRFFKEQTRIQTEHAGVAANGSFVRMRRGDDSARQKSSSPALAESCRASWVAIPQSAVGAG